MYTPQCKLQIVMITIVYFTRCTNILHDDLFYKKTDVFLGSIQMKHKLHRDLLIFSRFKRADG